MGLLSRITFTLSDITAIAITITILTPFIFAINNKQIEYRNEINQRDNYTKESIHSSIDSLFTSEQVIKKVLLNASEDFPIIIYNGNEIRTFKDISTYNIDFIRSLIEPTSTPETYQGYLIRRDFNEEITEININNITNQLENSLSIEDVKSYLFVIE